MTKVIRFQNNLLQLEFLNGENQLEEFNKAFEESELGKMKAAIPWQPLIQLLTKKSRTKKKGPKALFDLRGKLALMFLKSYYVCSDADLINRLNSDWKMQMFCGAYLRPCDVLKNFKIVSSIRTKMAKCFLNYAEIYELCGDIQELFCKF